MNDKSINIISISASVVVWGLLLYVMFTDLRKLVITPFMFVLNPVLDLLKYFCWNIMCIIITSSVTYVLTICLIGVITFFASKTVLLNLKNDK